jgi:hypothetical protein
MIRQLPLPFPHAPMFDGTAFLQAPSNAEALAWLERPDEWPLHRLALWGEAGSGKTHLLHRWARRTGAVLLDGASLVIEPPSGPVAIDDADLAGERPLLHLLNATAEAGYAVVFSGRAAPARWAIKLPDLASRLRATLAVEIRPAEDELLRWPSPCRPICCNACRAPPPPCVKPRPGWTGWRSQPAGGSPAASRGSWWRTWPSCRIRPSHPIWMKILHGLWQPPRATRPVSCRKMA